MHIVWIPDNGSGKVHTFFVNFSLLRLFTLIVFLCICSVPFLETGLFSAMKKVDDLEQKKELLHDKILTLQYIKKSLAGIQEKERMLRNYFGMEKYESLEQIMVGGGELNFDLTNLQFNQDDLGQGTEKKIIDPEMIAGDMNLPTKLRTLTSNFEILNQLILIQEKVWGYTPSIIPVNHVNPRVSSGFGWRKNPFTNSREFHAGIDIIGTKRTMIIAPSRGVVVVKGFDQRLGNYLVLEHNENVKTIYGHLHKVSIEKGMQVKRGETLGLMGNTGLSTSCHLHYGVIVNGRTVDPMQYILDANRS